MLYISHPENTPLETSQQLESGTFILKYWAAEWYILLGYMAILMHKNLISLNCIEAESIKQWLIVSVYFVAH